MREPTLLEFSVLIAVCLILSLIGLYLLARFNELFKGKIRNELLRKNVVAWMVTFCLSAGILPLNGHFFYIAQKLGWGWAVGSQFIISLLTTLIVYNLTRMVAESRKLQRLSFFRHKLLVFLTLIVGILGVNVPLTFSLNDYSWKNMDYIIISSIYLAGAIALVYAVTDYLGIERKRKFQEKELELSKLRELKAKAELDALHSKVNPHFLYNALNSIADLSITDGSKARKMTVALADLFRYSINYSNNNYTTVRDEVEMAEVYLQIEKIRFEDKLNYTIEMDPDLHHYLVPRFVLQPLVENAVKHGLKVTGRMTHITITVKKAEEGMVLGISDTGPAFPDELNVGYGVKSVYDKLDLLFKDQYEIRFSNSPQKQVSVFMQKLIKHEPVV